MTDIPLYFQPTKPSSGVYLVAIDGECEGGAQAELACHLWLNTVLIPGELATPGYNRAWSLRTVLSLLKRAPEAGDRGTFLTVYECRPTTSKSYWPREASASLRRSRPPLLPLARL